MQSGVKRVRMMTYSNISDYPIKRTIKRN